MLRDWAPLMIKRDGGKYQQQQHIAFGQRHIRISAVCVPRYAERKDKFSPDLPEEEPALFQNPDAGFSNFRERKQLMAYLQQLSVDENTAYNQTKIKRLYRLARFFTRLRLYPLAMKCFFKTIAVTNAGNADTTLNPVQATDSAVNYADAGYLNVDAKDDSVVEKQINLLKTSGDKAEKSKPIGYEQIVNTFNDGKKAVAYALIFHVKQPVRGKRKIFVWSNTGHTFITLIKYNSDSTYASISFGFYPKKDNILSATPIIPLTSSVFKNDSGHDWDEVLGKFISKRRFDKILLLAKEYNHFQYHLSKNNCTDFGLRAASVGGLNIWDTSGSWPLGSGNNPGVTGQSIINGKFKNAETGDNHHLLVDVIPPDSSTKK
eukprot:gene8789-8880_t